MTFRKNVLRCVSVFISVLLLTLTCYVTVDADTATSINEDNGLTYFSSQYDRTPYSEYSQKYESVSLAESTIQANIKEAQITAGEGSLSYSGDEISADEARDCIVLGDGAGTVKIPVLVDKEGLYQLKFTYYPLHTSSIGISLSISIDDELPFTESGYCTLRRLYTDGDIYQDDDGHDMTPDTNQKSAWIQQYLMDTSGIYGNYNYYFSAGEHYITIQTNNVPFVLKEISLCSEDETQVSYSDYTAANKDKENNIDSDFTKKIQAEDVYEKSTSSIYPSAERTSIALEPFDYTHSRINILNGSNWVQAGDYVTWEFEVPSDGYYKFGIKYRQNYLDGLYASRNIKIDDEFLFDELKEVKFDYSTDWSMMQLGGDTPYEIYLTEGRHTITLENTLGNFTDTVDVMSTCIELMNELYLDIVEITGSAPDANRDYYLDDYIPDISQRFTECSDMLFDEAKRLSDIVKIKGAEVAVLEDTAYQLKSYAEDIDSLTASSRLDSFNTNIKTISSKVDTLADQGLDLDYIVVASTEAEIPSAKPSFFAGLWGNIKLFLYSFSSDYEQKEDTEKLRVWISGGQEQLELAKKLVRDKFTPEYGIDVDIQLVTGTLQKAALAGNNPDVALQISSSTPVNFALRGALLELSSLDGFDELKKQYRDGSFTPYTINDGVYGIPSTESFEMLFIREDIFAKMGLPLPQTWEDLLDLAPILQRKNMQVGLSVKYSDLVFQYGGKYYNDELTEVCFNENSGVEAFKLLTSFFTDYGFPITYDFVTRFRSGEIPIGVASYSMYNTISYSAPEINGLWGMYPLLGTEGEDGTINNSGVAVPESVSIIFKNTERVDDAWTFLKWWADSETQASYGLQLEALMGVSARYTTANTVALKQLPWTETELAMLTQQQNKLHTLPILPGTYYVDRCYDNAYLAVINDGENPREMLNKWVESINEELVRKQAEFDKNND